MNFYNENKTKTKTKRKQNDNESKTKRKRNTLEYDCSYTIEAKNNGTGAKIYAATTESRDYIIELLKTGQYKFHTYLLSDQKRIFDSWH